MKRAALLSKFGLAALLLMPWQAIIGSPNGAQNATSRHSTSGVPAQRASDAHALALHAVRGAQSAGVVR